MVAGGFDYLVKARVKDMHAYRTFLGEILVALPGVRETRTYAVLEEVKHTNALPLLEAATPVLTCPRLPSRQGGPWALQIALVIAPPPKAIARPIRNATGSPERVICRDIRTTSLNLSEGSPFAPEVDPLKLQQNL